MQCYDNVPREIESGQMLINKERVWTALYMVRWRATSAFLSRHFAYAPTLARLLNTFPRQADTLFVISTFLVSFVAISQYPQSYYLNVNHKFFLQRLFHGDKMTFHFAFVAAGQEYGRVPFEPASVGVATSMTVGGKKKTVFCGNTLAQVSFRRLVRRCIHALSRNK